MATKSMLGFNQSANDADAVIDFAAASSAVVLSTFGTDTIGTTAEDGYIVIYIAGSPYKIPFWQDT